MTNSTLTTSKTLKRTNPNLKSTTKNTTITISSLMMKMIINPNKRSTFYPQLTLVIPPHQNPLNNHLHPKRILMLTSLLEVNKSWMTMISKSKLQIKSLKKKYNLPNNKET